MPHKVGGYMVRALSWIIIFKTMPVELSVLSHMKGSCRGNGPAWLLRFTPKPNSLLTGAIKT